MGSLRKIFPLTLLLHVLSQRVDYCQSQSPYYLIPALGRSASLGEIFDRKTENFTGTSVFSIPRQPKNIPMDTNKLNTTEESASIINTLLDKAKLLKLFGFWSGFVTRIRTRFVVPNRTLVGNFSVGDYVNDDRKYSYQAEAAVVKKVRTVEQVLRSDLPRNLINSTLIKGDPLVVVRITYGLNLVVRILGVNSQNNLNSSKAFLSSFVASLTRKTSDTIQNGNEIYQFRVFSDLPLPNHVTDISHVRDFLKSVPALVSNNKGVPVEFTLMPLSSLRNLSKPLSFTSKPKYTQSQSARLQLGDSGMLKHLSDSIETFQMLSDLESDLNTMRKCIPDQEASEFKELQSWLGFQLSDLKKQINKIDATSFREERLPSEIPDLLQAISRGSIEGKVGTLRTRISNCRSFAEGGIQYFGEGDRTDKIFEAGKYILVLYYSIAAQQKDAKGFEDKLKLLHSLNVVNLEDQKKVVIDCEFHPSECILINASVTELRMYKGSALLHRDVFNEIPQVLQELEERRRLQEITAEAEARENITTDEIWANSNRTNNDDESGDNSTITILAISVAVAALAIVVAVLVLVIWASRRTITILKNEIRRLSEAEVQEFFEGCPNFDPSNPNAPIDAMPFDRRYEIHEDDLIIHNGKVIGSGAFGLVMQGSVRNRVGETSEVAVKINKASSDVTYCKSLLSELKILAYLGQHDQIVSLIGAVTANIQNQQVLVAIEWCQNGDLHKFLVENRKLFSPKARPRHRNLNREAVIVGIDSSCGKVQSFSTVDLLLWSLQIAQGMMFLEEKKVIHGDLAARNILLTGNNCAKISDFGLSRQLIKYQEYKKKTMAPLPWRWMAVESLRDLSFSLQSDVWSYGVTLWELFTLGEAPFPSIIWDEHFLAKVTGGHRLHRPRFSSAKMYNLMLDCWTFEPGDRPNLASIIKQLEEALSDMGSTKV